jgi:uncharacterized membrane protein SirB2
MDGDLYDKWKMMWDAKEWSTQGFFLVNAFVALVIISQAVKNNDGSTSTKRGITFVIGAVYLILVVVGYLQLVPTVSPYQ